MAGISPAEDVTVLEMWRQLFQVNQLTEHNLRAYWREEVPPIFSLQPNAQYLNVTFDDTATKRVLFDILEQFAFNKSVAEVLQELKGAEKPSVLCGRVFKVGEPTYSCRDCGMDPTCVLCVDCFKKSVHKNHRYKMSTSGGGGYCDCGDKEAWKVSPYCELHVKGAHDSDSSSPLDTLPLDTGAKCKLVFNTVLEYCHQMLIWEKPTSLPEDLKKCEVESTDTYVTMLFNDEIHTYEQVIKTLQRAIECTTKEAIDYATLVDREGRSIVKCADFTICSQVKGLMERITSQHGPKPLRVTVMHTSVVAHQAFALRLLGWMQQLISGCRGFRLLFAEVVSQKITNRSILESIMQHDTQLWKAARTQWHQLFITGMLMEQDSKKTFSKMFTQNYSQLIKDFINDDHDHSLSVTTLSVQIFTVPTLAHMLIMEMNILTTLLHTFIMECETKLNADGKLTFERNLSIGTFRRAQYILFDLKYLLSSKPEAWSAPLRRNFLHGLGKLLELLAYMQGMDMTIRQVGQHMEFEPEWESAFNLYIRLTPVLDLVLEWCGTDRVVLIKAYRATLKKLSSIYQRPSHVAHEVADHTVACVSYDVAKQPVSIHLPLSRLVAGLHLQLGLYDLTFDSSEFQITDKLSPVFLIEMPLRTLVMIGQVNAGMWRRNGYSLVNQIYFYHNVRCRAEMYDRDIVMLQIGASLIEGNEFLIHLLNKFGLTNWVKEEYESDYSRPEEDSVRQIIMLVEEFLGLLITLVSERFVPGVGRVTKEEVIRKEVIQLLCIEPMAHSQLSKMLPEDPNYETGLEAVIHEVATFRKPHGTGKGIYELKPKFYKEYNLYFYHYGKEEQSKAEETQRKRKKLDNEEECCPPPLPPPLCPGFAMLINFLQCDVMLHIMSITLERCLNLRARTFSETQFQKLLHLIGYALHEEQRSLETGDPPGFQFTQRAVKANILSMLEALVSGSQRISSHKDLLNWVLRKFRKINARQKAGGTDQPIQDEEGASMEVTEEEEAINAGAARAEKLRRAEMAAARRARILAQMSDMQKNFIRGHADLFEETPSHPSGRSGSEMDLAEQPIEEIPVCLGPGQTAWKWVPNKFTCILCQEDQEVSASSRPMVFSAFVQQSTVLSKNRSRLLEDPEKHDPLFAPSDLFCAPHTSTCGHAMHADCWQKFLELVLAKERRRSIRIRHHLSFDVDKQEFLCPLCECLSNTVIPIVPALATLVPEAPEEKDHMCLEDWLTLVTVATRNAIVEKSEATEFEGEQPPATDFALPLKYIIRSPSCKMLRQILSDKLSDLASKLDSLFSHWHDRGGEYEDPSSLDNMKDMITLFSQATYTIGLGVAVNENNARVPLLSWYSCAYSIHTIENVLRDVGKPLFGELSSRQSDCLSALVRFSSVCAHFCDPSVISTHCHRLLVSVLHTDQTLSQSILDVDAFGLLVTLIFLLPYVVDLGSSGIPRGIPRGSAIDLCALELVYVLHALQILITTDFSTAHGDDVMDVDEEDDSFVLTDIYNQVKQLSPSSSPSVRSSFWLLSEINRRSLPFLRCSALFFHYLTGVPAPPCLCEVPTDEHEALCKYLGLNTGLPSLLNMPSVRSLVIRWLAHPSLKEAVSLGEHRRIQYPLAVNQLWPLPADYSELINGAAHFTCPNSDGDDSRTPSMCLVCGQMLCSQSYCCQTSLDGNHVGACTNHAHYCGAGVGIFLRVRECKVVLMAGRTKGCFVPPPYLDQYGETDQGLKRGNPLHLCEENYKKLHKLWLSHGIPEEISHSLELNAHIAPIDWQHL